MSTCTYSGLAQLSASDTLACGRTPCTGRGTAQALGAAGIQEQFVTSGELLAGRLTKAVLGTAAGGIVDLVCRAEGGDAPGATIAYHATWRSAICGPPARRSSAWRRRLCSRVTPLRSTRRPSATTLCHSWPVGWWSQWR